MIGRSLARRMGATEGATAVEFALIAMLLFVLMFGIFEGGRVFHGWLVITNEAREGARWGAVRVGDPSYPDLTNDLEPAVETYVTDRTDGQVDQDPAVFDVECTASEDAVTVQIDYTVVIVTPLISALWPDFGLTAESTMRSE